MTTALVILLACLLIVTVALLALALALRIMRPPPPAPLEVKRVRVFTKPFQDGTDDTIEGTLAGVRAGHYVLIHAVQLEAPGADGTPLDGEVWLPTENIRTIQVLAS